MIEKLKKEPMKSTVLGGGVFRMALLSRWVEGGWCVDPLLDGFRGVCGELLLFQCFVFAEESLIVGAQPGVFALCVLGSDVGFVCVVLVACCGFGCELCDEVCELLCGLFDGVEWLVVGLVWCEGECVEVHAGAFRQTADSVERRLGLGTGMHL